MRRRTARTLLACALLPASLVLGACSGLSGSGELDYVPGDGGVVEFAPEDREPPIDLSGFATTTGETYTLERGQVTVVNVWWSGCGPCIREMPLLTELDAAYDGAVEFVGINIKDTSLQNARTFELDRGVDYPSIYPGTQALLAFPGRTSPRSMPTTLVLDPEGVVVSLVNGEIPSRTTLTGLVEDAGGPPAPPRATADEDAGQDAAQDADGSSDG